MRLYSLLSAALLSANVLVANEPPVAQPDVIFYTGQINFDPLLNDSDPDGDTLSLNPMLVTPPTAGVGIAIVGSDGRSISYNPQFSVFDEDTLTYQVIDPEGATDTAEVRLITFDSRAGYYAGAFEVEVDGGLRKGGVALQLGRFGAVTTAFVNWAEGNYRLRGGFDSLGTLEKTLELIDPAGNTLRLTLKLDAETPVIRGSLLESDADSNTVAQIDAFTLARFSGLGGFAAPGIRTAFLEAREAFAAEMGSGYLTMTVSKDGRRARFAGKLPDGEPFTYGNLGVGRTFLINRKLERGGRLAGTVRVVENGPETSGMLAELFWKKVANPKSRFYKGNLQENLSVTGKNYPFRFKGQLPPIALGGGNPNATLRIEGAGLESPLEFPLHFLGSVVSGFDATQLRLKFDAPHGRFNGKFRHPVSGKFVPFAGVFRTQLDAEADQGRGLFRLKNAAGTVRIEGN